MRYITKDHYVFPTARCLFVTQKESCPPGGIEKLATRFFMADRDRKQGRRPADKDKRTRFVNVRFTEKEVELLGRLEKELGLSRTDYIRLRALQKADVVLLNSGEVIARLDAIGRELGYIGNNINQLARYANLLRVQGKLDGNVILQFNELFEKYLSHQRSLELMLRKTLRITYS